MQLSCCSANDRSGQLPRKADKKLKTQRLLQKGVKKIRV
jgi:hypothetical protein